MKSQAVISADLYNAARSHLIDSLRRFDRMPDEGFWATLSGTTSPYSWVETIDNYGTWTAGPRTGTTDAYEVNTQPSLNGKRAWLIPSPGGKWAFQYSRVGGAGGGIGVGCSGCSSIPSTSTMSFPSSPGNPDCQWADLSRSPVYVYYGTIPASSGMTYRAAGYGGYGLGAGWFTDSIFTTSDGIYGLRYYLIVSGCTGLQLRVYQVPGAEFPGGGAAWAGYSIRATLVVWSFASTGNSCSPFLMTNGGGGSGGTCVGQLS